MKRRSAGTVPPGRMARTHWGKPEFRSEAPPWAPQISLRKFVDQAPKFRVSFAQISWETQAINCVDTTASQQLHTPLPTYILSKQPGGLGWSVALSHCPGPPLLKDRLNMKLLRAARSLGAARRAPSSLVGKRAPSRSGRTSRTSVRPGRPAPGQK